MFRYKCESQNWKYFPKYQKSCQKPNCHSIPTKFSTGAWPLDRESESVCTQGLTETSESVSDHVSWIAETCAKASESVSPSSLQEQFRLCAKAVNSALNAFLCSIRAFKGKFRSFSPFLKYKKDKICRR